MVSTMLKLIICIVLLTLFVAVSCDESYESEEELTTIPPKCPKNEVYSSCIQGACRALNCSQLGEQVPCVKIDPKFCKKGCICAEGYLRNEEKICVPENKCPQKCPKNEVYSYCIQGECKALNCSQLGEQVPCVKIDPKYCKKGCICAEGYLRNEEKNCVLENECPQKCPKNEVYSNCIQGACRALNCSQLGEQVPCVKIDPKFCKKGCICAEGYLRNEEKICVPENKCPQKCPKNEVYSYCIQGECKALNCSQLGEQVPCVKIDPKYCKKGCICAEGYLRNEEKICVLENECPNKCPEYEIYNKCPAVKCDADYCPKNRTTPLSCPIGIVCDPPRCTCAFNRRRSWETKKCIPTVNCPPFKCERGCEKYYSCPAKCPSDKCYDYVRNETCGAPDGTRIGIVVPCAPECRCDKGFYRNSSGYCVTPDQCK